MTSKNTHRWIEELNNLILRYNKRKHSTTKISPLDALKKENFEKVYDKLYKNNIPFGVDDKKLKVGDYVRISRLKNVFEKGHFNWTEEVFKISEVRDTNPTTYKLEDLMNDPIEGSFYRQELKLIKYNPKDIFRVEKILKYNKNKTKAFVKWMGYPSKFDSWVTL